MLLNFHSNHMNFLYENIQCIFCIENMFQGRDFHTGSEPTYWFNGGLVLVVNGIRHHNS